MNIFRKSSQANEEKTPAFSVKKLAQAASTAVLILCTLLCFVVVVQTALNQEASIFGFRLFYVVTGSMEPTLPVNSLLLVQEQEEYQVGDIITYYAREAQIQGYPNTHRIIAVSADHGAIQYTTQGDANPIPDPDPVERGDVIGRVVFSFGAMAILGMVLNLLTTPVGFFAIVLLPLLSIAVISMGEFKKAMQEELQRAARESLEAELAAQKAEQPEENTKEDPEACMKEEPQEEPEQQKEEGEEVPEDGTQ